MFEERKARMGSEIANLNRALDKLKPKCRCHESRNEHAVAFY